MSNEWLSDAACRGLPLTTFFLERGMNTRAAKAVCSKCQVREECLESALKFPGYEDEFGVFGGMSPEERHEERRRRQAAKAGGKS